MKLLEGVLNMSKKENSTRDPQTGCVFCDEGDKPIHGKHHYKDEATNSSHLTLCTAPVSDPQKDAHELGTCWYKDKPHEKTSQCEGWEPLATSASEAPLVPDELHPTFLEGLKAKAEKFTEWPTMGVKPATLIAMIDQIAALLAQHGEWRTLMDQHLVAAREERDEATAHLQQTEQALQGSLDREKLLKTQLEQANDKLIVLVSGKEPNGYPLWFNCAIHDCPECDSEDLCMGHLRMAERNFFDCDKNIEDFIAAFRALKRG